MTSTDDSASDSDLDFHPSNCGSDTESLSATGSLENVEVEEKPTRNPSLDNGSPCLRSESNNNSIDRVQKIGKQSVKERMVTSVRNEDRPKGWFTKEKTVQSNSRRTRAMKALAASPESSALNIEPDMQTGSVGRKVSLKAKKKGKNISPAIVDVVFGRVESSVADVEELRRKREEDARKCGRPVRTVGNVGSHDRGLQNSEHASEDKDLEKELPEKLPPKSSLGCQNLSPNPNSTECMNPEDNAVDENEGEFNDIENSPVINSFRKEQKSFNVEQQASTPRASNSTISRIVEDRRMHVDSVEFLDPSHNPRSPSALLEYPESNGRRSRLERSNDSMRRSPRIEPPMKNRRLMSPTPRRSPSRSPRYQRRGDEFTKAKEYEKENGRRLFAQRIPHDVRDYGKGTVEGAERRWRRDSSGTGGRNKTEISLSPDGPRRERRRSPSSEKSRSLSVASLLASEDDVLPIEREHEIGRKSDLVLVTSSASRKTRRNKQAIREDRRSERKNKGMKPFYLTLTSEGIPYGPGRPAWVAEVNKLAAGLDPSITHIRKQTHEDMCILKDRLDDHFEYSGELNQDHLRGLLGKAVTRKRTELITFINNNGNQPLNFNREMWKRLEKLASSKQREKLTEHGRYANGCRRTVGRTGALGMEGIRRKLGEMYGRSPDPEEVAEEMERDKGYGKKHVKSIGQERLKSNEFDDHVKEQQNLRTPFTTSLVHNYGNEEILTKRSTAVQKHVVQSNDERRTSRGIGTERGESHFTDSRTTSAEDYIARLEAELRVLRGNREVESSSWAVLVYDSGNPPRQDSDGGMGGSGARTSRAMKTGRTEMQKRAQKGKNIDEFMKG